MSWFDRLFRIRLTVAAAAEASSCIAVGSGEHVRGTAAFPTSAR
jgi:hypothetical protein